jgi:hypothetical protein
LEASSFVLQQQLQQETAAHLNAQREQASRINVLTFENHRLTEQLKSVGAPVNNKKAILHRVHVVTVDNFLLLVIDQVEGELGLAKQRLRDLQSELIRSQDAHRRLQESHKHIDETRSIEQQKNQHVIAQLELDLQAARDQLAKQQETMSKISSDYADQVSRREEICRVDTAGGVKHVACVPLQVAGLEREINQKIPQMAQKAILRAESSWSEKTRTQLAKLHQECA